MNDLKEYKILIIDDEKMLLQMYKTKFEKEGFQVAIEENGLDGLNRAVEMKPDIILLDMMMPGIDGMETLKGFRECTSLDVIIVIFSNLNQDKSIDLQNIKEKGADACLIKANHSPSQVAEKVKELILQKKQKGLKKVDNILQLNVQQHV